MPIIGKTRPKLAQVGGCAPRDKETKSPMTHIVNDFQINIETANPSTPEKAPKIK